jgi:hypothetical protein
MQYPILPVEKLLPSFRNQGMGLALPVDVNELPSTSRGILDESIDTEQ